MADAPRRRRGEEVMSRMGVYSGSGVFSCGGVDLSRDGEGGKI